MSVQILVVMGMSIFVTAVDMRVHMGMIMYMGVNHVAMSMGMRVRMNMLVNMLQFNGIPDHQYGSQKHYSKSCIELYGRSFA